MACLAGIFIVYVGQSFSPLRLDTDSIMYMHMAHSASEGDGFTVLGHRVYYPSGYPAILSILHSLGLASSFMFVFTNVVFMFLGAGAFSWLFHQNHSLSKVEGTAVVILFTLSFVTIKHTTLIVSEATYFFFSAMALLLLEQAKITSPRRWPYLILATGFVTEAIWVRTVGISLIPALLFAIINPSCQFNALRLFKYKKVSLSLMVGCVAIGVLLWSSIKEAPYINMILALMRQSVTNSSAGEAVLLHATWKISEISQSFLNIPATRVPNGLMPAVYLAGVPLVFFMIRGIGERLNKLRCTDIYFLTYATIILTWHYFDTRFWLPVLPFLFMYTLLGLKQYWHLRLIRFGTISWISVYCLMGIAAMGYSSFLSFSGTRFAEIYGDGTYRNTYRAAFFGKNAVENGDIIDNGYRVLKWYDPRAKGN